MKQQDKAAHEATSAIFEALNYSSGQIAAVLEISAKAAQQKKQALKYAKFTAADLVTVRAFLDDLTAKFAAALDPVNLEHETSASNV